MDKIERILIELDKHIIIEGKGDDTIAYLPDDDETKEIIRKIMKGEYNE